MVQIFSVSVLSEWSGGSSWVNPATWLRFTLHFSPCHPWVKWHGRSVHFDLEECLDHTANTLRELVSSFRPRMLYAILFMWPGNRTPMFLMSLQGNNKRHHFRGLTATWALLCYLWSGGAKPGLLLYSETLSSDQLISPHRGFFLKLQNRHIQAVSAYNYVKQNLFLVLLLLNKW